MAQWARKGVKTHTHTWADGLCTLRVENGAVVTDGYEPGQSLAMTAAAAMAMLQGGVQPITTLNDPQLIDDVRRAWAAQFEEPHLAPGLAHLLDDALDEAFIDEANTAFETAAQLDRAAREEQAEYDILICAE